MKKILLLILALSLFSLGACVNRSSSGGSSPLVSGLNQGGSQTSGGEMATVVKANSGVMAIYDGKTVNISPGMTVPANAVIRANAKGRAQLAFANGTKVNVSPNSEIFLADVAPASANASHGSSFAQKISDVFGGHEQNASDATIGVRGLR